MIWIVYLLAAFYALQFLLIGAFSICLLVVKIGGVK